MDKTLTRLIKKKKRKIYELPISATEEMILVWIPQKLKDKKGDSVNKFMTINLKT